MEEISRKQFLEHSKALRIARVQWIWKLGETSRLRYHVVAVIHVHGSTVGNEPVTLSDGDHLSVVPSHWVEVDCTNLVDSLVDTLSAG